MRIFSLSLFLLLFVLWTLYTTIVIVIVRTLTTKTRIITVIADFDNENQDHMLVPISSLNLHVMEDHGRKPPTTFYLPQDSVPLLSLLPALSSKALFMA